MRSLRAFSSSCGSTGVATSDYLENTPTEAIRASMLEVASRFLKDNGVILEKGGIDGLRESLEQLAQVAQPFTTKETT